MRMVAWLTAQEAFHDRYRSSLMAEFSARQAEREAQTQAKNCSSSNRQ
jgi:cytochrome P450